MESTYKKAFIQIINFLENLEKKEEIKYYLVGGVLVNIYSDLRLTQDIDIVIDFHSSNLNLEAYINILKINEFNPFQDWSSAIILARETNIVQFLDKSDTVRYDNHIVVRHSRNKFKRMGSIGLKRRVREKIFGMECWATSKEDFILSKLVFGGWQDYCDALGCWMRFNDELDTSYLKELSKELEISKEYNLLISGIEDPDEYFEKLNGY
jgi:hypothetical protein